MRRILLFRRLAGIRSLDVAFGRHVNAREQRHEEPVIRSIADLVALHAVGGERDAGHEVRGLGEGSARPGEQRVRLRLRERRRVVRTKAMRHGTDDDGETSRLHRIEEDGGERRAFEAGTGGERYILQRRSLEDDASSDDRARFALRKSAPVTAVPATGRFSMRSASRSKSRISAPEKSTPERSSMPVKPATRAITLRKRDRNKRVAGGISARACRAGASRPTRAARRAPGRATAPTR